MEFIKKSFLELHQAKISELEKRQREYGKIISSARRDRRDRHRVNSKYEEVAENLRKEAKELRARIWVAQRGFDKGSDERNLEQLECQVNCQEHLSADIAKLKKDIANMERDTNHVNKEISALNKKTVPETQFQEHFRRTHKKMQCIENELEMSKHRECVLRAENTKLRAELINMIKDRSVFNESYTKMVQRLSRDKKYMADLIEYALGTFENCMNVYDKMESRAKKDAVDREKCKEEMVEVLRDMDDDSEIGDFFTVKNRRRKLADIPQKEYKRREEFRRKYNHKVNLYRTVLQKIMVYTRSKDIRSVMAKYHKQENIYYSYFNYANEMSYHITLVEHAVGRLYADIENIKEDNADSLQQQLKTIRDLEDSLKKKMHDNKQLYIKRKTNDTRLDSLVDGIEDIFEMCRADATPMMDMLGDHTHVHLSNIPRVLKIIEKRIFDVVASVFVMERLDESKTDTDYVVQQIHNLCEWPTALEEIVLTQQCPECAEGDAFHVDESGEGPIHPITQKEAKKKLCEKVIQPEMQYRLHNIEDCRLPRSRILAAKKNT